jgi:hypothetical protein
VIRMLLLVLSMMMGAAAASSAASRDVAVDGESEPEAEYLGDDFIYDVIARTNEGVVSNIDAADLALLAVLTAIAAVVVFGIDKIRELVPFWERTSYLLLAGSVVACVRGYLIGIFKIREPIDPRRFVIDFATDPEKTTANATRGTMNAYYLNVLDRKAKRIAVAVALGLLVLGTIVIAVARSGSRW